MQPAVKLAAALAALLLLVMIGARPKQSPSLTAPVPTAEPPPIARAAAPLPATVRAWADATDRAVDLRNQLCRCDGAACLAQVQDRFVASLGDTRLDPARGAAYDEAVRGATTCILERSARP